MKKERKKKRKKNMGEKEKGENKNKRFNSRPLHESECYCSGCVEEGPIFSDCKRVQNAYVGPWTYPKMIVFSGSIVIRNKP